MDPARRNHHEQKLRQFVAARTAGDEAAMRRWWDELVTDNFDRVRGMVVAESYNRLSRDEQDDAVQRSLIKIANNMIITFEGTSMGEWVLSTRTLVKFMCMDTQRDAMTVNKRTVSEAAGGPDGDEYSRWDAQAFALGRGRVQEDEAEAHEHEEFERQRGFLDWALPQLSGKRRKVLELDRDGLSVEEIQEQLNMTGDAVYQSRSRGLRDLAKLKEQWPT